MADAPAPLLDHVHLRVSDLAASRAFYAAAVGALGREIGWEDDGAFEIGELFVSDDRAPAGPVHIAFRAASRAEVDRFHAAALGAGGRDNGAPGERAYHAGYYGAYVLDPDGNNVEAVFHHR